MDSVTTRIVKRRKMAHKREADRRNMRGILIIVLGFLILYLILACVVLFVNSTIARIDEQFALVLAYTIGVAALIGIYAVIMINAYVKGIWPLFDAALVTNVMDQTVLHSVVPVFCFISIILLWLAYARTGGGTQFGTLDGEIDSGATMAAFSFSALAILVAVENIFSYFRMHAERPEYISKPGLPWKSTRTSEVEEVTKSGVTYLVPANRRADST